ncbi:unnamed protein product [Leptidea sinapis]|uniref:Uncharacterized protein n=1 Tax=Leptidea sinapis TaxID=189913 RepID=A0A5E4QD71_9NEOP|nr:unnamed protein product [Leptidea sinapis]
MGGGVLLCASKKMHVQHQREWGCPGVESLWATIPVETLKISGNRNIHIGLVYAPPDSQLPIRLESIYSRLAEVLATHPNDYFILCGDFNLPNVTWTDSGPTLQKRGPVELQNAFRGERRGYWRATGPQSIDAACVRCANHQPVPPCALFSSSRCHFLHQVKRFSYTTSTENSTTALKMWALERNCTKHCEPGCIVIGERTKLYACTSCCTTSLCNYGSGGLRNVVSFNILLLIALSKYIM